MASPRVTGTPAGLVIRKTAGLGEVTINESEGESPDGSSSHGVPVESVAHVDGKVPGGSEGVDTDTGRTAGRDGATVIAEGDSAPAQTAQKIDTETINWLLLTRCLPTYFLAVTVILRRRRSPFD